MKGEQMYKIYVNKTKVVLLSTADLSLAPHSSKEILISNYSGKIKNIFNYLDMFEKSSRIKQCYIHFDDYGRLKEDFISVFRKVPAGGGLVMNEKEEILFIFRRGYWDLPKGKIDEGETKKEAALREVKEETGVKGLELGSKLIVTNHTYKDKKKRRCIKKSHWYKMSCKDQILIPQVEEDIIEAKWMTLSEFDELGGPVYKSISDVLDTIR